MRHAEHGHAAFGETDHGVQHFLDHLRVERRSRLVEQHDLRLHAQRPGDRHPLLLAAGELTGKLVGLLGNAHALEIMHGDLLGLPARQLAHPHRCQGAVLQHGQVRKQIEVLEDHADFTANRLDLLEIAGQLHTIDDDPPLLMLLQPIQAADGGGLARPGRPAQHDAFALPHGKVDVLEHMELAEPLVHALHADDRLARLPGLRD